MTDVSFPELNELPQTGLGWPTAPTDTPDVNVSRETSMEPAGLGWPT